jgi:hypothetical protein
MLRITPQSHTDGAAALALRQKDRDMPDIEIEDNIVGSIVDSGNIEDNNVEVGNTDVDVEDNNVDSVVGNDDNNVGNVVGNEDNGNTDSYNETDVDIEDSGNETDIDVEDSGNEDSYNETETEIDTDIDVEDVGNTDSYNETDVDVDITDSFNETTLNDDSVTVGVRQYNTGIGGDLNLGGMMGGGAAAAAAAAGSLHLELDNRATVVDQSVSQNVAAGDDVSQFFGQEAVVNSGDNGAAAGDDATVDNSTVNTTVGDVNIGNEWITTTISDSFQDNSTNEWNEFEVEIDDSFNDYSEETDVDVQVEDSFNDYEVTNVENEVEWENSGNFFSPGGDVAGDDLVDF